MIYLKYRISLNVSKFLLLPIELKYSVSKWRSLSIVTQDDETEQALSHDYEIGHFIRERIVPRAVLYFTGDALDDEVSYNLYFVL